MLRPSCSGGFLGVVLLALVDLSAVERVFLQSPTPYVPAALGEEGFEGSGDWDYQNDAEAEHSGLQGESGGGIDVYRPVPLDPLGDSYEIYDPRGASADADKTRVELAPAGPRDDRASTRDKVDKFLQIVEEYERNKGNCTPGVTFNLGDGVITQYGLVRFKDQAMMAVSRANFLTRVWKHTPKELLTSEYFFYAQVRSMVEADEHLFAAGNCYDKYEFNNYTLFCPYGFRLPSNKSEILVKDLSVEYMYLGNESEFFYRPRQKAALKLSKPIPLNLGKSTQQLQLT